MSFDLENLLPARVVAMGERAVLINVDGLDAAHALYRELHERPLPDQLDVVPGARSVLVCFDRSVAQTMALVENDLRVALARSAHAPASTAADTVTVDVVYDGPDLEWVGEVTGLGPTGVIAAHTGGLWEVAFCGFAPGFAYLTQGSEALDVPRLDTPRERIPGGSVALAGGYSAVYPAPSPGGWRLIGYTDATLWAVDRDPPALLRLGMRVQFLARRGEASGGASAPAASAGDGGTGCDGDAGRDGGAADVAPPEEPGRRDITVHRPGTLCLVEDLGRNGYRDVGVSPSGAADRAAATRANALVGNDPQAALLECLLGGLELEFHRDAQMALTGAPVSVTVRPGTTGRPSASTERPTAGESTMDAALDVPAGTRIRLGRPAQGVRTYLAVRGGIDAPAVLGSRSADVLAQLGPHAFAAGDGLTMGPEPTVIAARAPHDHVPAGASAPADAPASAPADLAFLPGPQAHWFAADALDRIATAEWTVSPASNRVALRLDGPQPERIVTDELPSQGLVRGAIQVPPSGELVVFLADHPVTGGYPVIAVLTETATDAAAQARPGGRLRLRRQDDQRDPFQ